MVRVCQSGCGELVKLNRGVIQTETNIVPPGKTKSMGPTKVTTREGKRTRVEKLVQGKIGKKKKITTAMR